jgi:hypothetical protein
MIGEDLQAAVARFYATLTGPSSDMLDAFNQAREDFIDDNIEWIWMLPPKQMPLPAPGALPFGTYQGADSVFDEFLKPHTEIMDVLIYSIESCFPTRGTQLCVFGRTTVHLRVGGPTAEGFFVHIWEFENGRATRLTAFAEDNYLNRALGVADDVPPPVLIATAKNWSD